MHSLIRLFQSVALGLSMVALGCACNSTGNERSDSAADATDATEATDGAGGGDGAIEGDDEGPGDGDDGTSESADGVTDGPSATDDGPGDSDDAPADSGGDWGACYAGCCDDCYPLGHVCIRLGFPVCAGSDDSVDSVDATDAPVDSDDGYVDGFDGSDIGPGDAGCYSDCYPFGHECLRWGYPVCAESDGSSESDACADATDSTDGGEGSVCTDPPTFAAPRTHFVSLVIPPAADDYKCDSDNNGTIDAKDGELNGLLAGTLKSLFDVNAGLAAGLAKGDIVLLADIAGCWEVGAGTDLTLNMYLGSKVEPDTAPCFDVKTTATDEEGAATATTWDGESTCDFSIDPKSFYAAFHCPIMQITGADVVDGKIDAGPVGFPFSLPLGATTLDVYFEFGRMNGDITDAFRITNGRLCGEIPLQNIKYAFESVCTKDPSQQLCSYKDTALPLIEAECKKSGEQPTNCTISIAFESAVAGAFVMADPQ